MSIQLALRVPVHFTKPEAQSPDIRVMQEDLLSDMFALRHIQESAMTNAREVTNK